jgi:dTDP-4-dehydrorhamnose reductase/2-polyprenyl-3-methyl-5-hydroxy-6-metoxy-1,4-benzoquinol methylase
LSVAKKKILLTGGYGQLAREILKLDSGIDAPDRPEMDFSRYESIERYCEGKNFEIVIHAGAVTNKFNEQVDEQYIESNIIGTSNIVLWAMRNNARLVYISSDYVYPSERGDYTEESALYPVNRYAKSKLGGEMAVQLYEKSLIIRTSFYVSLQFSRACTDQYTSRISIRDVASAVYKLSLDASLVGIINLGSSGKRSLYTIVRDEFNHDTAPIRRKDISISYIVPPDSSLDTSKYHRIMDSSSKASKNQSTCRMCGSVDMLRYLDLGKTPLANSYLTNDQLNEAEFSEELALQVCRKCGLSQLTKVVHPDLMFKNYLYVSSTTQTFQDHCVELAATAVATTDAKPGDLIIDVASNDGCLLSKFQDIGMNVLGVDPAENLAAEANSKGIRTLCTYWSKNVARDIVSRFSPARVITATNVFAHVDDIHEFVEAVNIDLAPKGIFIIEFPYLVDFIKRNEFDTAYHEHLSYIGVHPLARMVETHGMQVFNVQYFKDIHGGTVRIFVCRAGEYPLDPSVALFISSEEEFGILKDSTYLQFAKRILENREHLRSVIAELHKQGKTIWAYGASAKGNTLMNFFQLRNDMVPVAIDDNPKKWEYFAPGSHMRIAGIDELKRSRVDYLLLLAWNFQAEIMRRCKAANYAGGFIVPVPDAKILSSNN